MTANRYDIVVVGAGLAGLSCAARLQAAGRRVVVIDKARGVGGRLATRRTAEATFDHGAQYFTAREPAFVEWVGTLCNAGVVERWQGTMAAWDGKHLTSVTQEERYVAMPGMSALAKAAAAGLEIQLQRRVQALTPDGDGWRLAFEDGGECFAGQVVLATPPAQAAVLLPEYPALQARCQSVSMAPCWAVMLQLSSPVQAGFDGCFVNEGPLRWVARNNSKPQRPDAEAWVLHGSPEWTQAHLEATPVDVGHLLHTAVVSIWPEFAEAKEIIAHRWLYSHALEPLMCDFLREGSVSVAGDWLAGSRVEGAWRSGTRLAEALLIGGD